MKVWSSVNIHAAHIINWTCVDHGDLHVAGGNLNNFENVEVLPSGGEK